jgi:hypothetical protein
MSFACRSTLWLASALVLSACVNPQKLKQEDADQSRLNAELRERESADKCTNAIMPGTPEHMECRLGIAGGGAPPALAQ